MSKRALLGLFAASLVSSLGLLACGDDDPAPANPAGGASGAGGSGSADLCAGVTAPCVAFPASTTEAKIAEAIVSAEPNTTFVFDTGTFAFTNTLNIATAGVTVRGQGMDKTILDFKGQIAAAKEKKKLLKTNGSQSKTEARKKLRKLRSLSL